MKRNVFLGNMIRYGYMPLAGLLLTGLLNLAEFAVLTALGFAAAFAASAVNGKYSVLVSARYRGQVAEKLYRMEYQYFDEHSGASVINKVNADLNEAERFLGETFVMLVSDAVAVVIYADYVRRLNAGLFVLVLLCYPLVLWIADRLTRKIHSLTMTYREKTDTIAGIAQDALGGILVVRSFGLEDYFLGKLHAAALDLVDNEEKRTRITNNAVLIRKLIQWIPNIVCGVLPGARYAGKSEHWRTAGIYPRAGQTGGILYGAAV